MDGFDDLLAPSRSALESNPFADPFSKRSGSPDPWASVYQPSPSGFQDDTNAFGGERSTTPTLEDPQHATEHIEPPTDVAETIANDDPLEAAALTEDTQEIEAPKSTVVEPQEVTSPGFRESISHSPEPSESPARQPSPPPVHTEPESTPTSPTSPVPVTTQQEPRTESPSLPSKVEAAVTPSPSKPSFFSPLDQPGGLGIDRSFAGLSLGGEVLGGWQSGQATQNAWGNTSMVPSEDDDDDDDKPILQTRMHAQAQAKAQAQAAAAASVCSFY